MEHKEHKTHAGEEKKAKQVFEYPIVGKSKAVDQLIKQISSLAKSRRDVVLVGEAGVGKGAVAKNIYIGGKQLGNDGPFLSVNLSVVDDHELDALLFGHEHGVQGMPGTSRRGLFDHANGGTVLIEELEEASFRNQMKILTFMNERKARRQGSDGPGASDIRLIVTLKSDPALLAEQRKLMEELFVKVNEFERVEIPPLRQRQDDIPILIKHFTSEICKELGIPDLIIDINAVDVLMRQPWRDNIRELKSVIDKCVLFSADGRFMLPPELVDEKTEVVKMINNIMAGQEFVLDKSLDVIEKGIIERSLDKFGFNQSKAAQFLGMTEQTFRYKLKRLGIASARARG